MQLRARTPSPLRRAAMMAALVALAAAATAVAAPTANAAKKKVKAPVVTKVSPLDVAVGETLTIRGRNFRKGRGKNTVVFKRDGARAVFAKAEIGTTKMLALKVPGSVQEFFTLQAGVPTPTRFRIRVLSKTFAKKFTKNKLSPVISGPRDQQVTDSLPDGDCDGDGDKNERDADDDNDLLLDTEETGIGTNPCVLDTDGDTVDDGYEYRSAQDLNVDEYQPNQFIAYPSKMPYPNPGFADANVDYDGDTLTLKEEHDLWVYTYNVTKTDPHSLDALSYSDGEQDSGHNLRADGFLSDDERDEDADGLTNYDETHGRMVPEYWKSCYAIELPFQIAYGKTSHVDADTDGDGVLDGADDQDHDDIPNVMELSRIDASGWDDRETGLLCTPRTSLPALDPKNNHPNDYGRVNPFNPCLPDRHSRTCPRVFNSGTGAPFDGSPNWYSLN